MFRHVFPQIVPLVIVIISIAIPYIALLGASLSFLGLGLPPPTPSWGGDLSGDAREYFQNAPWMAIFPGAAISLTVLSFNMLGDAMRDILEPTAARLWDHALRRGLRGCRTAPTDAWAFSSFRIPSAGGRRRRRAPLLAR